MSAQSKKRLKKRGSRNLSPVLIGFLSIIFLSLFGTYRIMMKNITSAFSSESEDISSQGLYSVLYVPDKSQGNEVELDDLYLMVVNNQKELVLVVSIPKDVKIEALGRFGEESLENILMLGEKYTDEGRAGALDYLVTSIKYALRINIDRYVYATGNVESLLTSHFQSEKLEDVSIAKTLISSKDNLITDLGVSDGVSLVDTLDKAEISYITLDEFNTVIRDFVTNSDIALENKAVAVLNGSQTSGMAKFGGLVSENVGMRVIEVGNASRTYDRSILIVDDTISASAVYLMRFFNFQKVIKKKDLVGFAEPVVDRADITVIIGLDIAGQL